MKNKSSSYTLVLKYIALQYSKVKVATSCCFHQNKIKFKTPDSLMSNFENILDTDQGNNLQWPSLVDAKKFEILCLSVP